jgi:hypothetical protein
MLDELQENLKDLYQELTSGNISEVRRVAELQVSSGRGQILSFDVFRLGHRPELSRALQRSLS